MRAALLAVALLSFSLAILADVPVLIVPAGLGFGALVLV